MSLGNLVKDMTKRELYVLVLVSGMLQDADASWLEMYGNKVIKAAELMADKMLARVPEFAPSISQLGRPSREIRGDVDYLDEYEGTETDKELEGPADSTGSVHNIEEGQDAEGGDANGQ